MTKEDMRAVIDEENGKGFSNNINLDGYTFTKNNSFLCFELKDVEGVKICHIKYIHFEDDKDLITILVHCCNFWMGNKVQFIFYREKDREGKSPLKVLRELGFRDETIRDYKWKWLFQCKLCKDGNKCHCVLHSLYK